MISVKQQIDWVKGEIEKLDQLFLEGLLIDYEYYYDVNILNSILDTLNKR